MARTRVHLLFFYMVILSVCSLAVAQDTTGTISGIVTDASGAVVPGAIVTVTNLGTKLAREVRSDDSGLYVVPLLPVGSYKIGVQAKGFKTSIQTNIALNVSDRLSQNFALQVGNVTEMVEVVASTQQVETQSATSAGLITSKEVTNLALNSRNYEQLVALTPGVTSDAIGNQIYVGTSNPLSGQSNQVTFSIGGTRKASNSWMVDGADNVDRGANLTLLTYPSVDAIAEFKIVKGQYTAEYGRSSSGYINVITKSGTDKYHGNAYEFFRNDKLQANPYFNNANKILRPPLRYNNFGWTLGGPVPLPKVKQHTFFFFSEEFRRAITYTTVQATLPTAAEKQGIFPNPVCTIVTGTAGACGATSNIPQSSWSPLAAAYIKDIYSKMPDGPANNIVFNSFRNLQNYRQELFKIDQNFGPKHNLSVRYIHDAIPTFEPRGIFQANLLPGVADTRTNSPGYGWALHLTSSFTPTLINEMGYNFSYGAIISAPTGLDASVNSPDIKATLPFAVTLGRIPTLSPGFSGVGGFGPYLDYNRNHNFFDNITKVLGRHTLKAGFTFNAYQKTENNAGNNVGSFSFATTPRPTGSAAATIEQQWAYFLTGQTSSFTQAQYDIAPDIRAKQVEMYLQDDFRMKSNLTINMGVRYSYFPNPTDHSGLLSNFDPALWNPANAPKIDGTTGNKIAGTGDPLNGIVNGGKNSAYGDKVGQDSNLNFAPRIGFAWDPFKNGRTSVRSGYGFAYDSVSYNGWENNIFINPPINTNISIPNTKLDNPAAGTAAVSLSPLVLRGTAVKQQLPYVQQWSFDVQHEVKKGLILDVGYFGSRGTHLLTNVDLELIKPGVFAASGILPAGTLITSANTPRLNALRPFPGYATINILEPYARSSYHSLQASLNGQVTRDTSVRISYTWAKNLTDAGADTTSVQDPNNRKNDYGRAPIDRTQVLTFSYIYEIPLFRGQKTWYGNAFGGWTLSGITEMWTGLPLTVASGQGIDWGQEGLLGSSGSGPRPDTIGDPNANAPHTIAHWFNNTAGTGPNGQACIGAFCDVPAGVVRPGNTARNTIQGPGLQNWDVAFFKLFHLGDKMSIAARGEFFNFFNHTNPQAVGVSYATGSTTFGVVSSTRDSRIAQLGLKFGF